MSDRPLDHLRLRFLDDERDLAPGGALTFGRTGDLVVDEANPYLHRLVGRLSEHEGVWWLENLGSKITIDLVGVGGTVVRLPPTRDGERPNPVPLPGGDVELAFEVAGARYALDLDVPERSGGPQLPVDVDEGAETLGYGVITLTAEEHALVLRLAEPVLRDPTVGPEALPPNRSIARALDWPLTKFNRKLDYLCRRLDKAGVAGLVPGASGQANNRRWVLVEHAIAAGLVGADDLD